MTLLTMPVPMPVTLTATPLETIPELGLDSEMDRPWSTTVWDDPINLMKYVTYVFMEYFTFSKEKADYLMLLVHTARQGSCVNWQPRSHGERRCGNAHLWPLGHSVQRLNG